VPNCKSVLVTEAQRKHVRRCERFQQHEDARCNQVLPNLQGKAPKEIHAILTEILREHAPSYATVKNWVAQFKRGDFSTCVVPRPGRHKTVTTPEIIDRIHGASHVSGLAPSFMKIWTCGSSPQSGYRNA